MHTIRLMVRQLVETKRRIAINMPGFCRVALADYLEKRGFPRDWAYQRVSILEDDKRGWFWRYRPDGKGGFRRVDYSSTVDEAGNRVWAPIDFSGDPGTCYIIDDMADTFDNRHWEKASPELRHYFTYIRRPGDCVIGSCVRFAHLIADLRGLVNERHEWVDEARLIRRGVAQGTKLMGKIFTGAAARDVKSDEHAFKVRYPVDLELGKIYDTKAGGGMTGGVGDAGFKRKPILTFRRVVVVMIAMVALVVFGGDRLIGWGLGTWLGREPAAQAGGAGEPGKGAVAGISGGYRSEVPQLRPVQVPPAGGSDRRILGRIVGRAEVNGERIFYTSTGRVLRNPVAVLGPGELVTREGVWEF